MQCTTMQWEKVKKAGLAPTARTSFALVTHKKRAIMFGGVTDQHGRGDHMYSTLHDDLYQFNLDSRRWYPIAVQAPPKAKATQEAKLAVSSSNQQSPGGASLGTPNNSTALGTVDCDQGRADGPEQSEATSSAQLSSGSSPQAAAAHAQSGNAEASHHPQGAHPTQLVHGADGASEQQGGVQPDLADKLSQAGVDKESALYKAAARIQSRFRGFRLRKVRHLSPHMFHGAIALDLRLLVLYIQALCAYRERHNLYCMSCLGKYAIEMYDVSCAYHVTVRECNSAQYPSIGCVDAGIQSL